jgi:hypothetical protein
MDRTLTLYIPGSTWKSLKLLASKRDKTVEELMPQAASSRAQWTMPTEQRCRPSKMRAMQVRFRTI